MLNIKEINELSEIQQKYFVADISIRSFDHAIVLYIPIERISETTKPGFVSKRQLDNLSKRLSRKYSSKIEIIHTNTSHMEDLGKSIEHLIKTKYKTIIEEADLNFLTAKRANLWLKTKALEEEEKIEIEKYIKNELENNDISESRVKWISETDRLPSLMEILVMTKIHQPIPIQTYTAKLLNEHPEISEKWINRQLDKLIKKILL